MSPSLLSNSCAYIPINPYPMENQFPGQQLSASLLAVAPSGTTTEFYYSSTASSTQNYLISARSVGDGTFPFEADRLYSGGQPGRQAVYNSSNHQPHIPSYHVNQTNYFSNTNYWPSSAELYKYSGSSHQNSSNHRPPDEVDLDVGIPSCWSYNAGQPPPPPAQSGQPALLHPLGPSFECMEGEQKFEDIKMRSMPQHHHLLQLSPAKVELHSSQSCNSRLIDRKMQNVAGTCSNTEQSKNGSAKIFSCTSCGKQYCRKSTLKAHMKHHIGERPFICQICGKSFSQAANLTAHKRVHTGEKPFLCSVCQRPFSQSSSLVTHKRTHTGERPYPCNHCDKAFTDSSTLTKHLRTHTGHKPYCCHMCQMRFSQSGNLHRHMKTHQPDHEGTSK